MDQNILKMSNITKTFPGVKALDNVSFEVEKGEIHALVGENGAGKSTLMKILGGSIPKDSGEIFVNGNRVEINDINDSIRLGISIIYQEFNLIPVLSVAENLFLGRLSEGKIISWREITKKAKKLMEYLNFKIDVNKKVSSLTVAEMQMVEIAKAFSYDAELIIMDEPSATLTENELENFFKIIKSLKEKGVTVIYISHRLEEVFRICDRVTVLRDGNIISTMDVTDVDKNDIIEKMVGRKIENEFPERNYYDDEEIVLEVKDLDISNKIKGINFKLRKREILGIAGLVGAGRTELVRALFGADSFQSGEILINGKVTKINSTLKGRKNSIGYLPENRKDYGVIINANVKNNISITKLEKISKRGILQKGKESKIAKELIDKLDIRTPSSDQFVINLSGGNQQKIVVAKWLFSDSDILLFDEPTRGIDVGAKYEIYLIMKELVDIGKSIILISSELEEVIAMSDRVIIMHDGRLIGELDKDDASVEKILYEAIGKASK